VISLSASVSGVKEREAELRKFARMLDRPVINAFRRGVRRIATEVRTKMRGEGIGRSIWGRKPASLTKQVYGMRVTKVGDELTTGVKLKGLPAMIEEGGRVRPHQIKPRPGKALASAARNFFAKGPVQHPGMSIGARHFARTAMSREAPAIMADCNREIGVLKKETFG
jgi:hypothetical protein